MRYLLHLISIILFMSMFTTPLMTLTDAVIQSCPPGSCDEMIEEQGTNRTHLWEASLPIAVASAVLFLIAAVVTLPHPDRKYNWENLGLLILSAILSKLVTFVLMLTGIGNFYDPQSEAEFTLVHSLFVYTFIAPIWLVIYLLRNKLAGKSQAVAEEIDETATSTSQPEESTSVVSNQPGMMAVLIAFTLAVLVQLAATFIFFFYSIISDYGLADWAKSLEMFGSLALALGFTGLMYILSFKAVRRHETKRATLLLLAIPVRFVVGNIVYVLVQSAIGISEMGVVIGMALVSILAVIIVKFALGQPSGEVQETISPLTPQSP